MYAVVSSGGKQYRVEPGSLLTMERQPNDEGTSITFDRVLLVGDGEDVTVGTPTVSGATVSGTVLGEVLGPKIIIFKFKQKAKYRRRTGHRQHLVTVRIDGITANGKTTSAPEAEKAPTRKARVRPAAKAAGAASLSKAEKPAPKRAAKAAGTTSSPRKGAAKPTRDAKGATSGDTGARSAKPAAKRRAAAPKKRESKE